MRTILVALAVTIADDAPTPAGIQLYDDLNLYLENYGLSPDLPVIAVVDREFPENNVEEQLFTDYAPRSQGHLFADKQA